MNVGLSRKTKNLIVEPLAALSAKPREVDLALFLQSAVLTENRAGLLLAGGFDAAVRLVARESGTALAGDTQAMARAIEANPHLADLVSFALSDELFQARQILKLAIES